MGKIKKLFNPFFLLISVFLIFCTIFLAGLYQYYKSSISISAGENSKTKKFVIKEGESVGEIGENLEKEDLIINSLVFKIYIKLNNLSGKLQAGEYSIPQNLSIKEIVETLQHGTNDVWLTIVEGLRREEIAEHIFQWHLENNLTDESFGSTSNEARDNFMNLTSEKEGYLFPDTYLLPKDIKLEEIVEVFLDHFDKQYESKVKEKSLNSGLTKEEIVILASIVERETKLVDDRPVVAGILIKRYKNGWKLEADATVQYALGFNEVEKRWWKKEITADDLEIDSPYNTRKFIGLPPTPICNPSLDSLKAVVDFKKTGYWYYLSDQKGKMHYAITLEEHNQNIENFLGS